MSANPGYGSTPTVQPVIVKVSVKAALAASIPIFVGISIIIALTQWWRIVRERRLREQNVITLGTIHLRKEPKVFGPKPEMYDIHIHIPPDMEVDDSWSWRDFMPLSAMIVKGDHGTTSKQAMQNHRRSVTEAVKDVLHIGHKTDDEETLRVEMVLLMPSRRTATYYPQEEADDGDDHRGGQLPELVLGCKEVVLRERGSVPTP